MNPWQRCVVVTSVAWTAWSSSTVFACSGLACSPDQYVPYDGTVPANIAAIAWWAGDEYRSPSDSDASVSGDVKTTASDLALECMGAAEAAPHAVAIDVELGQAYSLVRPKTPLVDGAHCNLRSRVVACDLRGEGEHPEFWSPFDAGYLSGVAAFQVGAEAPLPAALGRLVPEPAVMDSIELSEGAGCSVMQPACTIDAAITFSDDARRWKDAFVYETRVDGKVWLLRRAAPLPVEAGASYAGRGREILFATQPGVHSRADVQGLSPGKHTVVIRAALPGTAVMLETAPVEIDLNCFAQTDAGMQPPVDAGPPLIDAAVQAMDAASAVDVDAGHPDDAGAHASVSAPRKRASSCSVSADQQQGMLEGLTLAVTTLVFALRRRSYGIASSKTSRRD